MSILLPSAVAAGALYLCSKLGIQIGNVVSPTLTAGQAALAFLAIYICSGGYKSLWLLYKTGRRDVTALFRLLRVKLLVWGVKRKNLTVPRYFQTIVKKHPNKPALIFEDTVWTFKDLDEYSNKVANYIVEKGFERNDCIALFMENRPQFLGLWLGFAKAGVVGSLINFNLRHQPLIHSIHSCKAKAVFCGDEMQTAIKDIQDEIEDCSIWVTGPTDKKLKNDDWKNLEEEIRDSPTSNPSTINDGTYTDNMLYIYTSGTTGMPKAAIIKHARYFFFASGVFYLLNLDTNDVIYNPLPLYHTAGGIVGMGQVLIFGCTSVIRRKFSVSNYWAEAKKHGCTVGQYVGEICRYLLNTPPKPVDKEHKIRKMFGNGVRAQIWEEFTERFNMPHIAEFYGSTEGNTNIVNYEGVPRACGFVPMLAPWAYPVRLVKIDEKTGEPVRDKNGFCVFSQPGEQGEFVGRIRKGDPVADFHGYSDKDATDKKIIRDVFSRGDFAFSSGDVLEMDELGYVYFKDRLGDTFRWRGENVSATEVEGLISQCSDHKDAVVFGVEVPGAEGKAGMAAIVDPKEEVDLSKLYKDLEKNLPPYARPVFVKILSHIDTTGTFKLKKITLQKEGYDIDKTEEKIYFLDGKQKEYVPLTKELYEKISSGKSGL